MNLKWESGSLSETSNWEVWGQFVFHRRMWGDKQVSSELRCRQQDGKYFLLKRFASFNNRMNRMKSRNPAQRGTSCLACGKLLIINVWLAVGILWSELLLKLQWEKYGCKEGFSIRAMCSCQKEFCMIFYNISLCYPSCNVMLIMFVKFLLIFFRGLSRF